MTVGHSFLSYHLYHTDISFDSNALGCCMSLICIIYPAAYRYLILRSDSDRQLH